MRDVSSARESQSRTKRYACFAAMAVAFFFFLTISGGSEESTEIVSGQATHTTHHTKGGTSGGNSSGKGPGSKTNNGRVSDPALDEDKEMSEADRLFKRTVDQQKAVNQESLEITMTSALDSFKAALPALLTSTGEDFTDSDISEIQDAIKTQLEVDLNAFIDTEAAKLLNSKEVEMENDLDLDAEDPLKKAEDEADEQEEEINEDLEDGIDSVFIAAKDSMKAMVAGAAKAVLEQTLLEKTGKVYVVGIRKDVIVSISLEGDPTPAPLSKTTKKGSGTGTVTTPVAKPTPSPTKATKKNGKTTPTLPPTAEDVSEDEDSDDDEDGDDDGDYESNEDDDDDGTQRF